SSSTCPDSRSDGFAAVGEATDKHGQTRMGCGGFAPEGTPRIHTDKHGLGVADSRRTGRPQINTDKHRLVLGHARFSALRAHLNPETVPVTHLGAFAFGGSGICPHASGISAVSRIRSLAISLSSQCTEQVKCTVCWLNTTRRPPSTKCQSKIGRPPSNRCVRPPE